MEGTVGAKAKELSALAVAKLTKPGMHAVGGVAGLYLFVSDSGARSWIVRLTVDGKRREMGLGGFADVPLAIARVKAAHPVFDTAVGPIGVYICYDRHFPEGWRELALNGAQIVFNPNATKPGLSNRLWEIEQAAAAAANGMFVAASNRVGREDNEYGELAVDFYGTSQVIDPRGNFVGELGSGSEEEIVIRDLEMDMVREMRDDWQFYRDRRPDSYTSIPKP